MDFFSAPSVLFRVFNMMVAVAFVGVWSATRKLSHAKIPVVRQYPVCPSPGERIFSERDCGQPAAVHFSPVRRKLVPQLPGSQDSFLTVLSAASGSASALWPRR